jgi:3-deoxy-D-manno-octulosonate 8-phosphate phosphatase KdsC-like HAD superfamily phosphatase
VKILGILNKAVHMQKQMKRDFVIDRLNELGITHTQQGKPIQELTYKELLHELVLAEMRQVDIDHPSHKWFR